jgi:hypothetical protein
MHGQAFGDSGTSSLSPLKQGTYPTSTNHRYAASARKPLVGVLYRSVVTIRRRLPFGEGPCRPRAASQLLVEAHSKQFVMRMRFLRFWESRAGEALTGELWEVLSERAGRAAPHSGGEKHRPGCGREPGASGVFLASRVPPAGSILMTNAVASVREATSPRKM